MLGERKSLHSLVVVMTLVAYGAVVSSAMARGGGHGGGHHGGHNHHPYHPSHHHTAHHSHDHHGDHHHDDHHHDHHYAHHHHGWHHGDWGPGFWGGAALGYGLGYGYGNWGGWGYDGGDAYVDNSTNVTPVSNDGDNVSNADDSNDSSADDTAADNGGQDGFPTDDWPELGIVTYAGEYGASQGQVIVRIVPGSAADKAGLVPGDVILTFNGKSVPSADDLDAALENAGGKFEVVVWDARTGRKSTIDGTLDPNAAAPPVNETAAAPPARQ